MERLCSCILAEAQPTPNMLPTLARVVEFLHGEARGGQHDMFSEKHPAHVHTPVPAPNPTPVQNPVPVQQAVPPEEPEKVFTDEELLSIVKTYFYGEEEAYEAAFAITVHNESFCDDDLGDDEGITPDHDAATFEDLCYVYHVPFECIQQLEEFIIENAQDQNMDGFRRFLMDPENNGKKFTK